MKIEGIIYQASFNNFCGTVNISQEEKRVKTFSFLKRGIVCWAGVLSPILRKRIFARRTAQVLGPNSVARIRWRQVANLLLFFSFLGFLFTFAPVLKTEMVYRSHRISQQAARRIHFADLLKREVRASSLVIPDTDFALVIPKIEASVKVLPNVDAGNKQEYGSALLQGVAHAKGTVFPGMKGNIYLFAHSAQNPWQIARYNAVFYLLRELAEGDEVIVYFYGGQHRYRVFKKEILPSTDTRYFQPQTEEEILVLQTCWPPGTTLKQLVVLAKKN